MRCIDFDKLVEKNSDDFIMIRLPNELLKEEINSINSTCNTNLDIKMLYFIQKIGNTTPSINNLKYFQNLICPKEEFNNLNELLDKVDKSKLNEYYLKVYINILLLRDDIEYYL